MSREITSGWKYADIVAEGDPVSINGQDVWQTEWRSRQFAVWLPHPQYPRQIHDYVVYDMGDSLSEIVFAAAELSNGCWGFYVPDQP